MISLPSTGNVSTPSPRKMNRGERLINFEFYLNVYSAHDEPLVGIKVLGRTCGRLISNVIITDNN